MENFWASNDPLLIRQQSKFLLTNALNFRVTLANHFELVEPVTELNSRGQYALLSISRSYNNRSVSLVSHPLVELV